MKFTISTTMTSILVKTKTHILLRTITLSIVYEGRVKISRPLLWVSDSGASTSRLVDRWRLLNLEILLPAPVNNGFRTTDITMFICETLYICWEFGSISCSTNRSVYCVYDAWTNAGSFSSNIYSYRVSGHISLYVTQNLLFGQKNTCCMLYSFPWFTVHGRWYSPITHQYTNGNMMIVL